MRARVCVCVCARYTQDRAQDLGSWGRGVEARTGTGTPRLPYECRGEDREGRGQQGLGGGLIL